MVDVDHRARVRRFAESRLSGMLRSPKAWAETKEAFILQAVQLFELLYMCKHERACEADVQEFQSGVVHAMCGPGNAVPSGVFDGDEWPRLMLEKAWAYARTRMLP